MKIVVLGLGYVGTVTAAGLASRGHDVVGVDVDGMKVEAVRNGRSPVVEPGLEPLLAEAVAVGRLSATSDVREALDRADVSVICVGTPSGPHGRTDLRFVSRALLDIRESMREAVPPESGLHSVVMRSTVPPGTGRDVVAPIFAPEHLPRGWAVGTAMCPEFLREGSGVEDFFAPPFLVLGTAESSTGRSVADMFAFLGREMHVVGVETAEALKYACNAFHATKVSFANEMGRVFRPYGVDTREVMQIFCEDEKLNISRTYLRPGFAFGGSCLPKDLRSLQHMARTSGVDVPLLAGTSLTNDLVVRDVVERVVEAGHRHVCLLGLSFKMNTDDLRESPNVELAERLIGKGFEVRIFDPIVNPEKLIGANRRDVEARLPHLNRLLARTPQEALAGAGVAVVSASDATVLAALLEADPPVILDLHGRLGEVVEKSVGYQGVAW